MHSVRIRSQFKAFRDNNLFFDVELRHKGETIKAHRMLLVKNSKWFAEELKKVTPPSKNEPSVLELPWNEENAFQTVLDSFYNQKLILTPDNAPAVLKVADFYQFDQIAFLATSYIKEFVRLYDGNKKDFRAEYCSKFVEYQMPKYYDLLVDYAAGKFKELFLSPDKNETVDKVYQMCPDGRFIAKIFTHKDILVQTDKNKETREEYYDIKHLFKDDEDAICEQFDYFFKNYRPNMDQDEMKALSDFNIIDWSKEEKFHLIIRHSCNWLDQATCRDRYKTIFSNRHKLCTTFTDKISGIKEDKVNRWYASEILAQVTSATFTENSHEIDVVKFMTTLGDVVDYVDPELFGFINPEKPNSKNNDDFLLKGLEPKNAFIDNNDCFKAVQRLDGKSHQYQFVVDFGPNTFLQSSRILIDMKNLYRNENINDFKINSNDSNERKAHKLPPMVYVESSPDNKKESFVPKDIGVNWEPYNRTLNKFVVTVDEGRPHMFLRYVDIRGNFLPNVTLPKE